MRQAFLCIFFLVLVCSHSLAAPKIQVSIDFEGNKKVSASSLKKVAINELADFRKKGLRPADADDAAFQMEQAYQKKGYPFVIVKYRLQKEKKKARLLFLVEEGQRVSIDTLEISGNSVFNDQTIRRVIGVTKKGFFGKKNFFVEDRLNSGISSLYDFYLYRGYMDVKISRPQLAFSSDKKKVQITVEIDEGSRFFIRGVEFEGEIPVSLIKKLGEMGRKLGGTPFQQRIPLFLKGQIQQLLGNSGYPEARVATVLKKIGVRGEVALRVSIHSGPLVKLRNVRIQGNEKTRAGLIFDRMMLKKGDLYTLDKKKSSFRNLFRTGFFKKVSMEIEEENGERDLVVHVTEALTKEFFFEGGWGSYERLRGKAGIKDKNIFGTGKIASLEAGLSTRSLFTTVSISDLWLFNTRKTGAHPVFYQERQEPSFTKIDSGFSVHISLPYTEFVNYSAEYGFQRTRLQNVSAQALQENQLIAYQQGIFKLQTTFDT
ncbi:MAG: outer membrane protein assembly factor, partial [Nitrospinota bacterium]